MLRRTPQGISFNLHSMSHMVHNAAVVKFLYGLYFIGGDKTKDVWYFNSIHKSWDSIAPMNSELEKPAAAVHNGILYVVGRNNNGYLITEKYDASTKTWTTVIASFFLFKSNK